MSYSLPSTKPVDLLPRLLLSLPSIRPLNIGELNKPPERFDPGIREV
jgi:hypothetical protein